MGTNSAVAGLARRWRSLRLAGLAGCATLALALLPAAAVAADAQIASLVDSPDPVAAGGLYSYTMRVDNNAVDAATNTRLTFTVPANAVFVSAAPASQNCAPVSATTVQCDLGSVGAFGADVRTLVLTWRATVAGPSVVNAAALLSSDNDANPANNSQNATTTVIAGANLGLTKTGTPDPAIGGGPVTYVLTTRNTGPNDGGPMVITDNLPPSVSFVSASGSGWLCSHAGGVVTCNRSGTLAVGGTAPPVTVVGTVNAAGGTVTNSATVAPAAGGVADPDSSNNTATVNTAVVPGADVRIAQKIVTSAQPATAGQNVSFQIQPRNSGPATAINALVSDVLPAGWAFVSASGPNWTCSNSGQTITCNRASLAPGATDNITVVTTAPDNSVVAPSGSNYTNTATVASDTPDPNATNNSGTATVLVRPDGADLRLTKTKSPNPVALGSNMVSLITLTNGGPRAATGPLRVVEALVGEVFVSASGTGWVCVPSGAVLVCDHPNAAGLAVAAALPVLRITTQASSGGVVSNQACTGSSLPAGAGAAAARPPAEGDPNPGNDCVTANATSTTIRPDLAISKTTSTPMGGDKTVSVSEASVTYTLVVGNVSPGADSATGVRFSDTVPGFIVGRTTFGAFTPVVSAGNAVFLCSASAAGTVTCSQTAGTLAPGETVTLPITVNRPLQDGAFTNTAVVSNTREGDPNSANNSASDTVLIEPIADVQMLAKTVLPTAVRAGENATYVISFRNNGPSPALNVRVSDSFTFPAGDTGLTVVSITSPGLACALAAGGQISPASPSFGCTVGTLANASAGSITLVVRPNFMPGNPVRSISNSAAITTDSREAPDGSDNGNNRQAATLTVNPAALNLLLNKTDVVDPVPYFTGATFLDYRVAVSNAGPSYGTGVKITETMTPPAGKRVRFVCDTAAAGSATCNSPALCSAANITSLAGAPLASFTCDLPPGSAASGPGRGELASGQSKTVFLRFEAPDQPAPNGDVFTNTAVSSANEPDTSTGNDREDEATTTRQRIDLRVAKTSSAPSLALNQPFVWTVTVQNRGPGNSLRTDLTDTLPAGAQLTGPVTFVRTLPAGNGTCNVAGAVVTCLLGPLDANGVATVTLPARFTSLPAGGSASNTATVDTDPAKTGGVDTPGGNNSAVSTVAVSQAALSGTVFEDRDRAGANAGTPQAAAAEPRLAGVPIRLTGSDAFGNAVDLSTTTDASGNYRFDALAPSSAAGYTVTETQPAGYVNSPASPPASGAGAPSAGGSYSAGGLNGGATGNSSHSGVVLLAAAGPGNPATQYNFPELRQPSLSGNVYLDSNLTGVREPGADAPIAGATVRLLDAATGALVASATTDAAGAYSFTNLDPLRLYTLEEPLPASPANLGNGPVNPGLVGGAACASGCTAQPDNPAAGTDRISAIDLGRGVDGTAFNFGERPRAAISGTVYIDINRNSALDPLPTDGRIPGVTLTLVLGANCSGAVLASTTTDAGGNYSFADATTGLTYTVCEAQPAGYLTAGENPGANGSSAAANAITISNLPLAGSAGNHFAEINNSPDLRVAKSHAPALFTVNNLARYAISVRNAGEVATSGAYTVSDRLPPGLSLAAPPAGGGWLCGGVVGDSAFSCTSSTPIAAGARGAASITVAVNVGAQAVLASPVNNAVLVDGGGEIDARRPSDAERALFNANPAALPLCDAAQLHNVCRDPAPVQLAAAVSGVVWFDIGSASRLLDGGDKRLPGWAVEIVDPATGAVLASATTGADGSYRVADLVPGVALAVRFRDPASGVVFGHPVNGHSAPGASGAACAPNNAPPAGSASSCVGTGANPALTVVLAAGQEQTQQSLPVDPSGVVYDSGNRQPVAGAVVTLAPVGVCTGWAPASHLVGGGLGGYAINGGSVAMTVGADGFYQFLFAPSSPPSCTFAITVTPPGGYAAPSTAIPPSAGTLSPPGGGAAVFLVQPQAGAPTAVPGSGTTYHLLISAGSAVAAIVHNHLPIDPALPSGISLSKTGDKAVAEVGDTVRYTVTVQLTAGARPRQTTVVDRLPAGFTLVAGSAMVDGVAIANPQGGVGPVLAFNLGPMPASKRQVLQYRLRVGVGSAQGDGINRARAHACGVAAGCVGPDGRTPIAGSVATNDGQHRVRVSGGVFGAEACVLGKIFVDCNGNHVQDSEELGIPGVRLVLSDGTTLISDVEGKYSVCGLPPRSHVLRADPHTLPRGARLTTSSNRNLGDAGSLWLDLKNGELHRADFVEGSCSNTVLDQVKARRAQGEVRAPETERAGRPALRFDSKSAGKDVLSTPQQGTDGANQRAPKPREAGGAAPAGPALPDEQHLPTPALPMNRPPPPGRATDSDPAAIPVIPAASNAGGSDAKR